MNNTQRKPWTSNQTRRSRVPRFPHLHRAPKRVDVLFVEVAGRGYVEVETTTFLRFRRRFPATAFRMETFEDMADGTFEYRLTDTRTGADVVQKIPLRVFS